MSNEQKTAVIGLVGPCGSGKSTLQAGLAQNGILARHIAQEHSYVKDMWQRITHPDILIYLHASYNMSTRRRRLNWTEDEYKEQLRRLEHARQHATLYIDTDNRTPDEILTLVLDFLKKAESAANSSE
jgi:cytidylate kinase